VRTTPADTPISLFREAFPLGSTNQVIAIEEDGRYAGMVLVVDAHTPELDATSRCATSRATPVRCCCRR
jgi:CIC family chloride channel protein